MNITKAESRKRWNELRAMVIEWDPLGLIAMHAPQDEYDCVLPEILHRLQDGIPATQMSKQLFRHRSDHFGASPEALATLKFCRRAVHWYKKHWDGSIV